jgi:predicted dinucleotide-binding enzyme
LQQAIRPQENIMGNGIMGVGALGSSPASLLAKSRLEVGIANSRSPQNIIAGSHPRKCG